MRRGPGIEGFPPLVHMSQELKYGPAEVVNGRLGHEVFAEGKGDSSGPAVDTSVSVLVAHHEAGSTVGGRRPRGPGDGALGGAAS